MSATRRIGAHVSASGGVDKAIERAQAIGANCAQVFSGSPRVWQRPQLDTIDANKVFAVQQKYDVQPIFTHSLYLINLASDNPDLVRKSTEALSFDLRFDAKLKGAGIIVHLGSHQGRGWDAVKEQVAENIAKIIADSPPESHFLMENAAGQQGKIGGDLTELRWLLDQVKSPQLGWCMDTCHTFASGYALGKIANLPAADQKVARKHTMLEEIAELNLVEDLRLIHVNDSRDPFGSGRDRHDNLGAGNIPQEDLRYFLNHDLIKDKPLILEVPGIEGEGPDAENITRLKKLVE